MFLIIDEAGTVMRTEGITDNDLSACDDGYISIIDISGNQPVQFFDGDWHGINNWEVSS